MLMPRFLGKRLALGASYSPPNAEHNPSRLMQTLRELLTSHVVSILRNI